MPPLVLPTRSLPSPHSAPSRRAPHSLHSRPLSVYGFSLLGKQPQHKLDSRLTPRRRLRGTIAVPRAVDACVVAVLRSIADSSLAQLITPHSAIHTRVPHSSAAVLTCSMLDVLDDGAPDGGARPSITPRLTLAVVAIAPALCLARAQSSPCQACWHAFAADTAAGRRAHDSSACSRSVSRRDLPVSSRCRSGNFASVPRRALSIVATLHVAQRAVNSARSAELGHAQRPGPMRSPRDRRRTLSDICMLQPPRQNGAPAAARMTGGRSALERPDSGQSCRPTCQSCQVQPRRQGTSKAAAGEAVWLAEAR